MRTWGDLKDDDPGSSLSPAQRYKLDNGLAAGQKFLAKWDWVKWQPGDYTPLA